jgi:nitrate reductase assembly molybdenum cofactor insertion protein NarJ
MSMQITNQTLRILGALLTYPSDELLQAIPEMQSILAKEGWLSQKAQAELVSFLINCSRWIFMTLRRICWLV